MMNVDHVKARVGGRDLVMKIDREDIPILETSTGQAAFALFTAFRVGTWRLDQLATVLRFAALPDGALAQERLWRSHGMPSAVRFDLPGALDTSFIDALLRNNGPANYAPLAVLVLGAALFGAEPEEASFSDEEPSG